MAHYDVYTDNGLTKWVIRGTGSGSRLSDAMDDTSPDSGQVNGTYGVWYKISNGTYVDTAAPEYTIALTTEPDGNAGDDLCIYHKEDTDWLVRGTAGSLNAGEWDWAAGTLSIRLLDDGDPDTEDLFIYYAWSHFMTETVEDAVYLIHLPFEIGDGSTATTLDILYEAVRVDDDQAFSVKANATLNLGELHEGYGRRGCFLSLDDYGAGINYLLNGGTLNINNSHVHHRGIRWQRITGGNLTINKSTLSGDRGGSGDDAFLMYGLSSISVIDVYIVDQAGGYFYNIPDPCIYLHIHDTERGVVFNMDNRNLILTDPLVTDLSEGDVYH